MGILNAVYGNMAQCKSNCESQGEKSECVEPEGATGTPPVLVSMDMRTFAIILNCSAAVFFASFLAYTYWAKEDLHSRARQFVTDRTLQYSGPIVDIADQALGVPGVQKFLTDKEIAVIRDEIKAYRADPRAFISSLTQKHGDRLRPINPNPLLEKVASIKDRIRMFYDDTLMALVIDLRIFTASNLVVAIVASCLALHSMARHGKLIAGISILMFVSVLYCSSLYVENLTFFRILFRLHLGWRYAVLLAVMLLAMILPTLRKPGTAVIQS